MYQPPYDNYPSPGTFGAPTPRPPKQWYERTLWIIVSLILFFPLGLFLMWRYAKWGQVTKGIVTGVVALLVLFSAIGSGGSQSTVASAPNPTQAVVSADVPTPTPTVQATPVPTVAPTPTPIPQQQVQPTQPPAPTSPPAPTCNGTSVDGVCYNFDASGSKVYSPVSDFCNFFSCINNFSNGLGYVVQCNDGMYSKSGGRTGSCSYHKGEGAILYQH